MENTKSSSATLISWILGIGLAAAVTIGVVQNNNADASRLAEIEMKAKADSLAVMKNSLQSEIETLSARLETEMRESAKTAEELAKANEKLTANKRASYSFKSKQRKELDELQLIKDNEIAMLNTKLSELNDLKAAMERELEKIPGLEENVAQLQNEVTQWKADYSKLEADFKDLNKRHAKLVFDAPGDNFKVEVLASNNKLTAKAKKAEYIQVSFLMPAYDLMQKKGTETIYLSLFDEQINPLKNWIDEVSVVSPEKSIPIQVHAKQTIDYSKNPQLVVFKVKVDEKMKPGGYTGKVYSKDDYLGTVDFKLRDSFL
ncbi:hypothetical protein SAMN06298216_0954 [Spirosomataceae bacterium TFI 002]|nr:hypothetical protein SAMN06298216_0954 [Spirosomataceae bacterium TFI 002]